MVRAMLAMGCILLASCAWAAPATTQATSAVDEGRKLAEEGNHVAALARYEEAIQADPSDGRAYAYKAVSLMELDRLDEAKQAIDKAIALRGEQPNLLQIAGRIEIRQGRIEEGRKLYERAAKASPANAGAIYNDLAAALAGRQDERLSGQIESALKAAVAADPPSLDAMFTLGQSYAAAGRQEGRGYLQRYVDAAGKLPEAEREPRKIQLARQMIKALDVLRDLPR